jgi:predicted RNA-binding Zn-ribbon protein involved in translation (DUF1610 family)
MSKNTEATWVVELNCDCPKCGEYVNLLDDPDFWEGRDLEIADQVNDVEVICPECGHEFKVDCEY